MYGASQFYKLSDLYRVTANEFSITAIHLKLTISIYLPLQTEFGRYLNFGGNYSCSADTSRYTMT